MRGISLLKNLQSELAKLEKRIAELQKGGWSEHGPVLANLLATRARIAAKVSSLNQSELSEGTRLCA
jgi:hypothetical protein